MNGGVTRIDPHVKILDDGVIRRAKARGLDALVYAPHFTRLPDIEAEAASASDASLTVLPGREIFTGTWRNRRHLLAVGLTDPVPDFIPLEVAIEECQRQGASILVPHPGFLSVSLSGAEVREYRDAIDAIEVANPKFLPHHPRRARRLAASLGVAGFGSSYAHLTGTIGEVWTEVEGTVDSIAGFQEAIAAERLGRVRRRTGGRHRLRCTLEFAHLFWENSWEKFDRVVRSGMEATHPRHFAYEGRFDDVACY